MNTFLRSAPAGAFVLAFRISALFGIGILPILPASAQAAESRPSKLQISLPITGHSIVEDKERSVGSGAKGLVMVFLSSRCPCSNSHIEELGSLANDFKDFSFVALHSNPDEGKDLTLPYFKKVALPFAVLDDQKQIWADRLRALKTPHSYIIDPKGHVLYQGGVTSSQMAPTADRKYLREALADLSSGREIKNPVTRTLGCAISRTKNHVL